MNNFSTRKSLMDTPHEELVWDFVTLKAKIYALEETNDKQAKEIDRLNSVVRTIVSLYLGRDE